MRKLSLWAKNNVAYARIIIVISHLLLIYLGITIGEQLSLQRIQFSSLWIYLFILIFIFVSIIYPAKIEKSKWHYAKQKTCDFIAAACGFCMVCCFISQLNNTSFSQRANAFIGVHEPAYKNAKAKELLTSFENGEKKFFSRKEKKIIKQEFRYQVKQYVSAKLTGNKEKGNDAGLIILSCIAALGLLLLVASLACSLSCNGSEAAATIVGILGTVGVIWGLIAVIKSIKRKHKKSPETPEVSK